MNKLCATLIMSAAALPSFAEEAKTWETEAELGVISTSGNTNTQSFKGSVNVKHELTSWRNQYVLEGLFKRDEVEDVNGETQDQTTAEKYFASVKSDYKLNEEHSALFVYGEYNKNRFSGFDYQYTLALGYTDRLFTTDNSYLSYDVGPGVTVDQPDTENAEEEETFIIRLSAEYAYDFSENAKFSQTISSNYSTDSDKNTKTKAVSALTAQINTSFALRASFTVDYNTEVPEGVEHADTETAVTVVYSF